MRLLALVAAARTEGLGRHNNRNASLAWLRRQERLAGMRRRKFASDCEYVYTDVHVHWSACAHGIAVLELCVRSQALFHGHGLGILHVHADSLANAQSLSSHTHERTCPMRW